MKGPRSRTRHDVHRLWECPLCHKRRITGVLATLSACDCLDPAHPGGPVLMRVVEAQRTPRKGSDVLSHAADSPSPGA